MRTHDMIQIVGNLQPVTQLLAAKTELDEKERSRHCSKTPTCDSRTILPAVPRTPHIAGGGTAHTGAHPKVGEVFVDSHTVLYRLIHTRPLPINNMVIHDLSTGPEYRIPVVCTWPTPTKAAQAPPLCCLHPSQLAHVRRVSRSEAAMRNNHHI